MKKLIACLAISAFLLSVSVVSSPANTLLIIKSSKNQSSSEDRDVSGFKGISSSGSYDVLVTMGNKEHLRLEGDARLISEIETVVENGILKIRNKNKNGFNWNQNMGKLKVFIDAKSLNSITLSGSGDLTVNGVVKADNLSNTLSGSGSISLNADAEEYSAVISGSGKIMIKGKAEKARVQIAGSGNFKGEGLNTQVADLRVSGSGNVNINADESLNAAVSGSGNIRYGGNAKVSQTKSGSGSISKM